MKESNFQALYKNYHNSSENSQSKTEALHELHHYVYQYAMRRFGADGDTASNFYMKIYDRIESFLKDYDPEYGISFAIYLAVMLKRHYFKFFTLMTKKESIYDDFVHNNSEISWDPPSQDNTEEAKDKSDIEKLVLEAIGLLELKKQLILRLYFGFYLSLSHLRELLRIHEGLHFFPLYKKYIQQIEVWGVEETMKRKAILEKAGKEYYKSQKDMDHSPPKNRHSRLIDNFYKIKTPLSLNSISQLVKKSTSQVHRLIYSAKEELKQIFYTKYREILKALGITS